MAWSNSHEWNCASGWLCSFIKFKYSEKATKNTESQENDWPKRKPIGDQIRTFTERIFSVEMEFYEFYKKRLHNQCGKSWKNSDNSNRWPDKVATNEIVPVDVLL